MCGREGEGEGEGMSDVVASPLASSVVGYGNKVEESGRRGEERSKKVREKILTSRLRAKKKSHIYFFAFDDFPVLEEKKKYFFCCCNSGIFLFQESSSLLIHRQIAVCHIARWFCGGNPPLPAPPPQPSPHSVFRTRMLIILKDSLGNSISLPRWVDFMGIFGE